MYWWNANCAIKVTTCDLDFFKIAIIGSVIVVIGTLSSLIFSSAKDANERHRLNLTLDDALADSMDGSDSTATY